MAMLVAIPRKSQQQHAMPPSQSPAMADDKPQQPAQAAQTGQSEHSTITTLLLDCDNTLTLTEEHAFAATAQTINTLLADFKIANHSSSTNDLLTESALQALDAENLSTSPVDPEIAARVQLQLQLQLADPALAHNGNANNETTLAQASTQRSQSLPSTEPVSETHSTTSTSSIAGNSHGHGSSSKYQTYSSASLLADYIGLPFRGILSSVLSRHNINLTPEQSAYYTRLEENNVNAQIALFSPPADGILPVLLALRSSKHYARIAVVSSSPLARIKAALRKAGLYPGSAFFSDEDLFSACDSLPKPTHKPSPAIYLHALETLGVEAGSCLAVEDSVSGCLAAVRAGVRCLGFVGAYHDPGKRDVMSGVLLRNGAAAVMGHWSEFGDWVRLLNERALKGDAGNVINGANGIGGTGSGNVLVRDGMLADAIAEGEGHEIARGRGQSRGQGQKGVDDVEDEDTADMDEDL